MAPHAIVYRGHECCSSEAWNFIARAWKMHPFKQFAGRRRKLLPASVMRESDWV